MFKKFALAFFLLFSTLFSFIASAQNVGDRVFYQNHVLKHSLFTEFKVLWKWPDNTFTLENYQGQLRTLSWLPLYTWS